MFVVGVEVVVLGEEVVSDVVLMVVDLLVEGVVWGSPWRRWWRDSQVERDT